MKESDYINASGWNSCLIIKDILRSLAGKVPDRELRPVISKIHAWETRFCRRMDESNENEFGEP